MKRGVSKTFGALVADMVLDVLVVYSSEYHSFMCYIK